MMMIITTQCFFLGYKRDNQEIGTLHKVGVPAMWTGAVLNLFLACAPLLVALAAD